MIDTGEQSLEIILDTINAGISTFMDAVSSELSALECSNDPYLGYYTIPVHCLVQDNDIAMKFFLEMCEQMSATNSATGVLEALYSIQIDDRGRKGRRTNIIINLWDWNDSGSINAESWDSVARSSLEDIFVKWMQKEEERSKKHNAVTDAVVDLSSNTFQKLAGMQLSKVLGMPKLLRSHIDSAYSHIEELENKYILLQGKVAHHEELQGNYTKLL